MRGNHDETLRAETWTADKLKRYSRAREDDFDLSSPRYSAPGLSSVVPVARTPVENPKTPCQPWLQLRSTLSTSNRPLRPSVASTMRFATARKSEVLALEEDYAPRGCFRHHEEQLRGCPLRRICLSETSDLGAESISVKQSISSCPVSTEVDPIRQKRSLFIFEEKSLLRRYAIWLVEWPWFDRILLFAIVLNSIFLASYQYRAEDKLAIDFNKFVDEIADPTLTTLFLGEFVAKVVALGLILDEGSYLRDYWNILDFVVVVSALLTYLPGLTSLTFLRIIRVMRPLASLQAVPQIKRLANATMKSLPRLLDVLTILGMITLILAVIGLALMDGIFYRRCHDSPAPILDNTNQEGSCWSWPRVVSEERLCGGMYHCEDTNSFCGGHMLDPSVPLRPWRDPREQGDIDWCPGQAPQKLVSETGYVHFDNIGGALLLVFQCMTLEGWTDIMYMAMDGYSAYFAATYFCVMVLVTNSFLLNVALAVVDESLDEFDRELKESQLSYINRRARLLPVKTCHITKVVEHILSMEAKAGVEDERDEGDDDLAEYEDIWAGSELVRWALLLSENILFKGLVFSCILGNVATMGLERFPSTPEKEILSTCESAFLGVFCFEMIVLTLAEGPKRYWSRAATAFDGSIVIISLVQAAMGQSGPLVAFRVLRLLRVLNKLASGWPSFRVLLKAMLRTGNTLNYWLMLFLLMLSISALTFQTFFANKLHFQDVDSLAELAPSVGNNWCDPPKGNYTWHFDKEECIPRANFDTFLWSVVTIFQIMTGENWNVIMYAGMRARGWGFCILFVFVIFFGQILFMSLFLSMMMAKFEEVTLEIESDELRLREEQAKHRGSSIVAALTSIQSLRFRPSDVKCFQPTFLFNSIDAKLHSKNALLMFSPTNRLRRICSAIVSKKISIFGDDVAAFDNLILFCIFLSTVSMMVDDPLSDPRAQSKQILVYADTSFVCIFILELVIKVIAGGFCFGEESYLRNPWNYLDGMVVVVSAVEFLPGVSASGFKILRVMRAFRPLRVISRFGKLRIVVQTMLKSLPELGSLILVSCVLLIVFALFFLALLNGKLYHCPVKNYPNHPVALLKDTGNGFSTPMCLAADLESAVTAELSTSCARGAYHPETKAWIEGDASCGNGACEAHLSLEWRRSSADTPLCLGRCGATNSRAGLPEWLCPPRYSRPEELPSMCPINGAPAFKSAEYIKNMSEDEKLGVRYVSAMQRTIVMPCGGDATYVREATLTANEEKEWMNAVSAASCRSVFCPGPVEESKRTRCEAECGDHVHFCVESCSGVKSQTDGCSNCRKECQAACECSDFCTPVVQDGALCHEQGLHWIPVLSQSFDNMIVSALTLFEIVTTEGWVDVMYAASDGVGHYRQPVRDNANWIWAPAFSAYILCMFMFILNLGVGVIVAKFLILKRESGPVLFTAHQSEWIQSLKGLSRVSPAMLFGMCDLHLLSKWRRVAFNIISNPKFDSIIMGAIMVNIVVLAMKVSPTHEPPAWWDPTLHGCNNFFTGLFVVECLLKLVVYRCAYFEIAWNRFDFVCVLTSVTGAMLNYLPFFTGTGISAIFGVLRALRTGRIFGLLKFMEGLNRVFVALLVSLSGLVNVALVSVLVLIVYGVFGTSVFATIKMGETLDNHGNFRQFGWSLATLLRASTGEAWNEIMHDLWRNEDYWFQHGDWCTPSGLFDVTNSWDVLQSKCLVGDQGKPNACVTNMFGLNVIPVLYWVSFTLFYTFILMNLVVAVILEGYEEGKKCGKASLVWRCVELWKKRDVDHTLALPLRDSLQVLNETMETEIWPEKTLEQFDMGLPNMRMNCICATIDMRIRPEGLTDFMDLLKQVLRFSICGEDERVSKELQDCKAQAKKYEGELSTKTLTGSLLRNDGSPTIRQTIAAHTIQALLKGRLAARKTAGAAKRKSGSGSAAVIRITSTGSRNRTEAAEGQNTNPSENQFHDFPKNLPDTHGLRQPDIAEVEVLNEETDNSLEWCEEVFDDISRLSDESSSACLRIRPGDSPPSVDAEISAETPSGQKKCKSFESSKSDSRTP